MYCTTECTETKLVTFISETVNKLTQTVKSNKCDALQNDVTHSAVLSCNRHIKVYLQVWIKTLMKAASWNALVY